MARKGLFSPRKKRTPRIEIIPMVDVMFLLLVFYILSTIALTVERGIPVSLPQAESAESTRVEETTITVDAQGDVYLNRDRVEMSSLSQAVEAWAATQPGGLQHLRDGFVVLNIDMNAPYRSMVRVMDQLRLLGISNFSIATEEQSGS